MLTIAVYILYFSACPSNVGDALFNLHMEPADFAKRAIRQYPPEQNLPAVLDL